MANAAKETDRERFEHVMADANGWSNIDDLVKLCDSKKYWTDDFKHSAALQAKKSHVRRMIRTLKDDENWPVWASVETTNEAGKTVRAYKQETLFDVEDYRKVVNYHAERSAHHRKMAVGYAARCKKRHRKQIALHFSDD